MTLSKFTNVKITGSVCVVPERHIDIDDEIKFYKDEKNSPETKKFWAWAHDMFCRKAALALICVKKLPEF